MSAPRTKRQFAGAASDPAQRQITAFFSTTGTVASSGSGAHNSGARVELPTETQSNLINVGMRVRKSVPEGYKTGTYSAFNLWADNIGSATNPTALPGPGVRAPPSAPDQRELLPFCGINKVGGLSSQPDVPDNNTNNTPSISSHTFLPGPVPSIDDLPSLTSSQDSVESTASLSLPTLAVNTSPPPTRKRTHTEDEDGDAPSVTGCLQVPRGDWMDGEVSPRTMVPAGWDNARIMAVPRKNRRNTFKAGSRTVPAVTVAGVGGALGLDRLGQENMMSVDEDFPEAEFLDYKVLGVDAMEI